MFDRARPRRSVLYMPGSNARALEKGRSLPADGLILDLEDAVAPDAKATAREQIAATLQQGGYGRREIAVRVNGLDSPRSEEHTSELQSLMRISYAVLCLKKKKINKRLSTTM